MEIQPLRAREEHGGKDYPMDMTIAKINEMVAMVNWLTKQAHTHPIPSAPSIVSSLEAPDATSGTQK